MQDESKSSRGWVHQNYLRFRWWKRRKIFIHCKRKTNWGETCRNPALDINILFCVFFQRFVNICIAYLSPVLQPLAFLFIVSSDIGGPVLCPVHDLSRMLRVDSGIDACKLTSWIGGTHSASTFKAEFYKITTYFYMKILKLSIVSETWSMGHCMGQGTTPHPDSPPTEDFENMFVHERVSDLKSCKMSLIQISPILTRLQLTRVKKCEAAGSYLPSAQSGVHGFTAAGWLLTDSAPATKIKIYYNVKLNLIKCERRDPAPAPATRLFVLAATARDELWQPHF